MPGVDGPSGSVLGELTTLARELEQKQRECDALADRNAELEARCASVPWAKVRKFVAYFTPHSMSPFTVIGREVLAWLDANVPAEGDK